jgi:transposase
VIGSYHEVWNIEKSFRMSKHDLRARPIYHRKRDSIEAHLTVVFAALAVTRFIEDRTGWSIHPALACKLQAYLRWRTPKARYPDMLAAQRRERARIRSERQQRWGRPKPKAA